MTDEPDEFNIYIYRIFPLKAIEYILLKCKWNIF